MWVTCMIGSNPFGNTQRLAYLFLVASVAFSFWFFIRTHSADLLASWIAGQYFAAGDFAHIYPDEHSVFTLYPPSGWREFIAEYGYDGPVYPFIYPPLWAWLSSFIPDYTSYRIFSLIMTLINPALLAMTILLARRAVQSTVDPLFYSIVAVVFLAGTNIGQLALLQNQPQILVSFLIVFAIERNQHGFPKLAGAALALAAALKLYPVLFVFFWLAYRQYRTTAWFLVFGLAMGLLSLFVAGWELHFTMFRQLSVISDTVMVTGATYSLNPLVGHLFFMDQLTFLPPLEEHHPGDGWYVMQKSNLWRLISNLLLIGMIAAMCLWMRRAAIAVRRAALWPMALTLVSLLAPLSWSYHFIPTAVFIPALLGIFPRRITWPMLALVLIPIFGPALQLYRATEFVLVPDQVVGTLSMTLAMAFFGLAAIRMRRASSV